jgi:hypothetical protein
VPAPGVVDAAPAAAALEAEGAALLDSAHNIGSCSSTKRVPHWLQQQRHRQ